MAGDASHDKERPTRISVVDRRHHARSDPAVAGEERSPYPTVVDELKARTEKAERRAREAVLSTEAELEAVRERLRLDVERRVALGKSSLLTALLEVLDNLDRAASAAAAEPSSIGLGIELIRQQMLAVLKAESVEPVVILGLPYDPHVAEAVGVEPVGPERDGLVVEEVVRGYRLGETVLRPARVKVGRAGRSETETVP